jgi:hypothetical protein
MPPLTCYCHLSWNASLDLLLPPLLPFPWSFHLHLKSSSSWTRLESLLPMNEFLIVLTCSWCAKLHDAQSSKVSLHRIIMLQIPVPNLMSKPKSLSIKNPWKVIKETFYDQSLMKKPLPISSVSPNYWTNLTNLLSQYCPLI